MFSILTILVVMIMSVEVRRYALLIRQIYTH